MKTRKLFFSYFLIFSILNIVAQNPAATEINLTPSGYLDAVFDKDGRQYKLNDLLIGSSTNGGAGAKGALLCSSSSGYFDVYFEAGSGMSGGSVSEISRRNVICQVLSDISTFITSPLTTSGKKVNIWVRNINNVSNVNSGTLGLASAYYNMAYNNTLGFGGIADNEIWKTIQSGNDSYTNASPPLVNFGAQIPPNGAFFHGMMAFNFNQVNGVNIHNWHTNLANFASNGSVDLYTVALHEITHALGFASLINENGLSKFGTGFNYYSRYDMFLRDINSNQNLIINSSACSIYNYQFALSPSILRPGCTLQGNVNNGLSSNSTPCSTAVVYSSSNYIPVYTPTCFEPASSLSHFEDECYPTNPPAYGNDLHFVMSNANGSGVNKRYLKPEERNVLCDLGYNVNTIYGSTTNNTYFNYGGSACTNNHPAGINDGITNTGIFQFQGNINTPITISGLLINDKNAIAFECLEDIYDPSAILSAIGGNASTTLTFSSSIAGVHLLRYVPVGSGAIRGNITYVYVSVTAVVSNTTVPCQELVIDGDFENLRPGATSCGTVSLNFPLPAIPYYNWQSWGATSPDYFGRACTGKNGIPSTAFPSPNDVWDNNSFNNNNHYIGLLSFTGVSGLQANETVQGFLNANLQIGKTYKLSFYARIAPFFPVSGQLPPYSFTPNTPIPIKFFGSNGYIPSGTFNLVPLLSMTPLFSNPLLVPIGNGPYNGWHKVSANFTVSTANINNIIFGNVLNSIDGSYVAIDNLSLKEVGAAPPVIASNFPTNICNTSPIINNLGLYYTINGVPLNSNDNFSITCFCPAITQSSGGAYQFNPSLAGSTTAITLNYTDCAGNVTSFTSNFVLSNTLGCCLPSDYSILNNGLPIPSLATLVGGAITPIDNKVFEVGDGLTLNINYAATFNNCKFKMKKNAKIVITSQSATATSFNNCQFYACDTYMWNGIVSENGAQKLTMTGCVIEDARAAINMGFSNVTLISNTFNKNYISVFNPLSPNSTSPLYTFKTNLFSCIPSENSPSNVLKLTNGLVLGTTYFTPPRSYAGIYSSSSSNSAAVLKIGSATLASDLNTFSNHDFGIYLINTKTEIYNNTFNIPLRTDNQDYSYGTAIYAVTNSGGNTAYGATIKIGGTATNQKNTFTSCYRGIDLNTGYDNIQIRNNIFNGTMTNLGTDGIILNNDRMLSLFCTSNNFSFQRNAFTHYFNGYPQFSDINSTTRVCSFSANTIQNNGLSNKGIIIANLGSANTATNGRYTIASNTIFGAAPITVTDLANAIEIQTCTLTVKNNIAVGSQNIGIDINNSNKAFLEKNVIASDAPAIANCTNQNIFGIKVTNSQQVQVKCNTLSKLGSCIAFDGNCQSPGNGLYGNNINSGKYGLRFINNAIIGQQSWSTTSPQSSKNVWGVVGNFPSGINGRQTFVENNAANPNTTSKLYLNSIPTLNASSTPGLNYTSGTGLVSASIITDECAVPPPVPASAPVAAMSAAIQPAANNTGVTDNNVKMLNKQAAYNLIEDMPSLKTVSSLNTFYNNNTNGCVGKLRQVQNQLRLNNYSAAKTTNNSFNPNCDAETHTKNYFDLYIKWKTDTLCCDSLFRNDVLTIANACPEKHGIVVNKAQALYNLITKSNTVFTANCNGGSGSRILNTENNITEESKSENANTILEENVNLSPNPNTGAFSLLFSELNNITVKINIYDLNSKLMDSRNLKIVDKQINIDASQLKSGVYLLEVISDKGLVKKQRLVINRND